MAVWGHRTRVESELFKEVAKTAKQSVAQGLPSQSRCCDCAARTDLTLKRSCSEPSRSLCPSAQMPQPCSVCGSHAGGRTAWRPPARSPAASQRLAVAASAVRRCSYDQCRSHRKVCSLTALASGQDAVGDAGRRPAGTAPGAAQDSSAPRAEAARQEWRRVA